MSDKANIDVTGLSYLQTFANNIYALTQLTAQYRNNLLKIEKEHGKNITEIKEEKIKEIENVILNLRHTIYLVFVQYKAIVINIDTMKENKEIETIYKKLDGQYYLDRTDLNEFVININSELMKETIKNLLESSQDIIDKIYNEKTKDK